MKIPICLIFPFVLLFPHARAENPGRFFAGTQDMHSAPEIGQGLTPKRHRQQKAADQRDPVHRGDRGAHGCRPALHPASVPVPRIRRSGRLRPGRRFVADVRPELLSGRPATQGQSPFPLLPLPGRSGRNGLAGTRIQKGRAPDVVCRFSGARAADKHGIHPGAGEHEPGRGKKPRTSETRAGTGRPVSAAG